MTQSTGIDLSNLAGWLADEGVGFQGPLQADLIPGGRSNLTYRVTDAKGRTFVLRRPPLHGGLDSAHDMGREARILRGLASSPVPVPRVVAECANPEVIGAAFFVMEFVEGLVARDAASAAVLPLPERASAGRNLVGVLATLHDVAPEDVGLESLGRSHGYIERQLARWLRQSESVSGGARLGIQKVHALLVPSRPEQQRVSIVHGDYRLDNAIISERGEVRAILDWELCTLGDPLADLGMLIAYWAERQTEDGALKDAPTTVQGFLTRSEVIDAYAAQSPLDLSPLPFYVAFALWKIAAIMGGVYERYSAGAYGAMDPEVADLPERAKTMLEQAMAILETNRIDFGLEGRS